MNWIFMYDCEYIIRTCNIQVANVHLSSYPAINSRNPGTLQIFSKTWWNIRIKIAMYIKYDVTVCGRNRRMWSEKLNTGEHSSITNLYGLKYMSNRNVNQFSSATTFVFFVILTDVRLIIRDRVKWTSRFANVVKWFELRDFERVVKGDRKKERKREREREGEKSPGDFQRSERKIQTRAGAESSRSSTSGRMKL